MNEEWREFFLRWSETDIHQQRVAEARRVIQRALSRFKKPYIAFSGGKDSTALLHLVLSFDRMITVLHWWPGPFFYPEPLEKEVIEIAKACGAIDLRVETSEEYVIYGRQAHNVKGRHYLGGVIPRMVKEEGYDLAFIGLRAEEAAKRKARTKDFFEWDRTREITNCFPIARWSWKDVWAYIVSNNIPYLSYYDKYGPVVGWDKARLCALFASDMERFGALWVDGVLMWRYRNVRL